MFFSILWHEGAKASKDSRWVTPLLQDGGVRLDTWCTEHGDADADGETRLVGLATAGWWQWTTPFCDFSCQNFGPSRSYPWSWTSGSLWKKTVKKSNSPTDFFLTLFDFLKNFYENSWSLWLNPGGITIICRKILIPSRNFPEENPGCLKVEMFFEHEHLAVSRTVLSDSHMSGWPFFCKLSRAMTSKIQVVATQIFLEFSPLPRILGEDVHPFLTMYYFCKWVGLVQPPTRYVQKGGGNSPKKREGWPTKSPEPRVVQREVVWDCGDWGIRGGGQEVYQKNGSLVVEMKKHQIYINLL